MVEAWPDEQRRRRGYVVWGEDWHEGVIGIVASRLVERFHRPVVLIAGGGRRAGRARAARSRASTSTPALAACSEHLERFGGHRAAAGLSIRPEQLEAFADAFAAHADAVLADDDLRPVTRIDAIVPASALTLDLAQRARPARAVRARQPRRHAARRRLRGRRARRRSARASTCVSAFASTAATRGSAIAFGMGGSSTGCAGSAASTSRSGSRRTAGTARSRRSSSSAASSTRPTRYVELRDVARRAVARRASRVDARGAAVFAELGLGEDARQAAAARVGDVPRAARARRCR